MANILTPHLGAHTADAVARHICAKYAIDEEADPDKLELLREFLRRGLVAYVGPETAQDIADRCIDNNAEPLPTSPLDMRLGHVARLPSKRIP